MQKKYQIFVSSTFRDLADERQDAIRSILDLGHIPAGMELFPASDTEQLEYIKKVIDECDYYILIMGGRYGSIDEKGVSFTEREYDYAVETGKVVLAFPHGDLSAIPVGKSEPSERMRSHLEEFRRKVMDGRLVREWKSREQLDSIVVKALVRAFSDHPAVGWVRGDTVASEDLLTQINDLRQRNDELQTKNTLLISMNQPDASDLAGFDDNVSLRFRYSEYYNRQTHYSYKDFVFTWREAFKAIGIRLSSPASTVRVSLSLVEHFKANRGTSKSYSLTDDSSALVKNQLAMLKLISVYVAKTLKDGSLHEFMQLTDRGKGELANMLRGALAHHSKSIDKLVLTESSNNLSYISQLVMLES